MAGHGVEDPVDNEPPKIPLVDTVESELDMEWEVHQAAGINRDHIASDALPHTEARVRWWRPPLRWNGSWHPPFKLPPRKEDQPHYMVKLVKWCPPMWWPPTQISEGQLGVWWKPGDLHTLGAPQTVKPDSNIKKVTSSDEVEKDTSGQREQVGQAPPLAPKQLQLPPPLLPDRGHPGKQPPKEHVELAERAYTFFGEFEAGRMRAFAHLRMPAPQLEIPLSRTLRDKNGE